MEPIEVTVIGAGVFGLWQAFELARRGATVTLYEAMTETESGGSSRFAGAMLAPYCESEAAEPIVRELGLEGLNHWKQWFGDLVTQRGTLVVAASRDQGELRRFARMTDGHRIVHDREIEELEPDLAGRFGLGLHFDVEAHLAPRRGLAALIAQLRRLGVELIFGKAIGSPVWRAGAAGGLVIDCRGIAAKGDLPQLRGVRGEMAVACVEGLHLSRPVRLLHPRFALYVVPWGGGHYMIGATMIERDDAGAMTLRSALDLLGTAVALHPAFADAAIRELSACVRPAFPDNVPRIVVRGRHLSVNGAFRHGYLLAPALARITADFILADQRHPDIIVDDGCRPA